MVSAKPQLALASTSFGINTLFGVRLRVKPEAPKDSDHRHESLLPPSTAQLKEI